jgi:uroporphyrinogen III methyltransferase/synthase
VKVLVTRPVAQSQAFGAALKQAGFIPVYFPVIEVRPAADLTPLDRALAKLTCYDWVVFTSTNSVEIVLDRPILAGGWPANGPRVAAIGPKTALALAARGIPVDFTPAEYVAEAILPGLGSLEDRWVLLPCAELARDVLPKAILHSGGFLHKIIIYQTLPAAPDPYGLAALRAGVDIVTLTSPSTVVNFVQLARAANLDPANLPGAPHYVCIGPVTRQAADEAGLPAPLVASEFTTDGLIRALQTINDRKVTASAQSSWAKRGISSAS